MKRISHLDPEGIINYNLRDGGTQVTVFADTQAYRIEKARWFMDRLVSSIDRASAKIIELGCSAGDISGPYAEGGFGDRVIGVDIVPAAVELARQRYPKMTVIEGVADQMEPEPCDILVLCEFLEHIAEPALLVRNWLPLAKYALIGHPLNDPGGIEPGHIWSYDLTDYRYWLAWGGHTEIETHLFSGPFPEMVMGISQR